MTRRSIATRDLGLLLAAVVAAGVVAALSRQDANWDLKNYHFYNAWAFVHGRLDVDLAPAQLQTYLSPLLDLPFYGMVAANWPPRLIAFVLAVPAGIGAFFLVKVLGILFGALPPAERRNHVAFAALIGLTAADPAALLASTMNEWPGAALTMAALWLLVRRQVDDGPPARTLVAAGFLSGVAAGLKLTAATFSVGLCAALLLRRPFVRRALPDAALFGVAVLCGLALTAGSWFHAMYARFGNPLFPFYNEIFRSPWWEAQPVLLQQFGPRSPLEWLYFPLLLFRDTARLVATSAFRDWRLPVLYVAALAAAIAFVVRRRDGTAPAPVGPVRAWRFVIVFWLVSYMVWLKVHGIYRYIIPLELLAGALLLPCLRWIFAPRAANIATVWVTVIVLALTRYPQWERVPFGERYVDVHVPPVEPHALVMLLSDEPMSYVLPFFPADARFVGARSNFIAPGMTNRLATEIARAIREHDGPLYSLSIPAAGDDVLAAHHLRRDRQRCGAIVSNLTSRPLEMCRLRRVDAAAAPADPAR